MSLEFEEVKVVNKEFLDNAVCGEPNCTHDHSKLYLSGDCHIGHPVNVRYNKKTGQLEITCARCDSEIVNIQMR